MKQEPGTNIYFWLQIQSSFNCSNKEEYNIEGNQ